MTKLQSILGEALQLSDADRRTVVKMLGGSDAESAPMVAGTAAVEKNAARSEAVEKVWPVIVKIGSEQGHKLMPLAIIDRHRSYATLQRGCEAVLELLPEFDPADDAERHVALSYCIKLLFDWMRAKCSKAPIGPKSLAEQLVHIGQIVDWQHPDYRECGMLPVAIHGLVKRKR